MELVHACSKERLPLMIGEDFNIICIAQEKKKNNDTYNERWPFLFNAFIDGLDLREIEMSGINALGQVLCKHQRTKSLTGCL